MATNLGTLMATVGVDTRPLKKGLKDAERETKASTGKMLAHWKSMAVGIVATYAVFKMAKLVKETALAHARFETLGIVMGVVGKNAGYSAAEMDKYDKALRKTGISMIESRNSLARMAMAQLDLTKATQLGRIAQDAAVIGNINSSEAFQRMIYGIQTGNLIVLRRIGINVSFEQSYKDIAKATNRTTASFTEAEKAIIRQNAVIKYGARIAGTYEAAMTTAGKKLTSFVRYVDDFKVKMGKAFGPATVMLVDAATIAMKEFQEEISKPEAQEALRNLSSQLAIVVVQLGKDLPKAVESITYAIAKLTSLFDSLSFSFYIITNRMDKFYSKLDKVTGKLFGIKKALTDLDALTYSFFITEEIEETLKKIPLFMQAKLLEIGIKVGIEIDEEGINQFKKMQEMLAKGAPTRLEFALADPDKYYGKIDLSLIYEQTKEMKEIYAKYYAALEEMEDNADIKAIMRERERLEELKSFVAKRHEIWLSAYEAEENRLDEYASYRTNQEKDIAEQIRAIRMKDKAFALADLKEKYENYKNFTDDLIGLELWRATEEKKIRESRTDDMTNAMMGWANSFSSTLNDMLWGADVTFKSILESFMKMITQMMIQKYVIESMFTDGGWSWVSSLAELFGGLGGGGAPGGTGPITVTAQGGIFPDGISSYSNQIVNRPTQFAFAKGSGLMGEKGPEAIMPLTRTPSGDLGVKAEEKGDTTIIILANDAKSFGDMVNRNPEAIMTVVGEALEGRTGLLSKIRETI